MVLCRVDFFQQAKFALQFMFFLYHKQIMKSGQNFFCSVWPFGRQQYDCKMKYTFKQQNYIWGLNHVTMNS